MEPNDVYIGRQPILDRNQKIFGYELLFRGGNATSAEVEDNVRATASVMVNTLANVGIRRLIGEKKGFINIDEGMLRSGIIELLPREQTVLEILETVELTDEVVGLCRKLRSEGYCFALDDFVYDSSADPMFDIVEYVKMDVLLSDRQALEKIKHILSGHRPMLLAEKVETREHFSELMDMGFNLFQGYFFARPSIITAKSISPALVVLIELLRLVSTEAEINVIEELFRRNPDLNIKLLRFMNSASFYKAQKISSIRQSIALLGYRRLQKWVTLLLFAGTGENLDTNPLLERAAIRGRIAELLAERTHADTATTDGAFITGVLSLADVLFQMPMSQVADELNLSHEIRNALVEREGFIGTVMTAVEGLESETLAGVAACLKGLGLTLQDLFSMEKTAIMEYESYREQRL